MKIDRLRKISIKPIIGVYFLFQGKDLIYIGKSTDIFQRIQQHKADKVFTSFAYKECLLKNLDRNEKKHIQAFNPKLNQIHKEYETPVQLPDKLDTDEFKKLYEKSIDNSGFLFEDYFIFKVKGELVISRLWRDKNKRSGYVKYGFRQLKGEINTNNSVLMKKANGWFKYKGKTVYFEPCQVNNYKLVV